jgi:hypothetical protein
MRVTGKFMISSVRAARGKAYFLVATLNTTAK